MHTKQESSTESNRSDKRAVPLMCGECTDFLWEDCWGYGICAKDNEPYYCNSHCMYDKTKKI